MSIIGIGLTIAPIGFLIVTISCNSPPITMRWGIVWWREMRLLSWDLYCYLLGWLLWEGMCLGWICGFCVTSIQSSSSSLNSQLWNEESKNSFRTLSFGIPRPLTIVLNILLKHTIFLTWDKGLFGSLGYKINSRREDVVFWSGCVSIERLMSSELHGPPGWPRRTFASKFHIHRGLEVRNTLIEDVMLQDPPSHSNTTLYEATLFCFGFFGIFLYFIVMRIC